MLSVAPTGRKLILKATIAALATTAALASASIGVARLSAPVVSSAPIPANLALREIFVDGSSLELAGTMTLAGQAGIACVRASLAAAPLELTKIVEPNCNDPGLIGEPVAPFVTAPTPGYFAARVAYDSNGRVDLGPVLASYPDDSGSHLDRAYGPGALWLYEDETASGPTVFRISEGTGRLVRATPVPGLVRPLLAADSAGLYLAGTGSYGGIGKDIIWHVGAEASKAQVVVTAGAGDSVSWITAQGEDVWADMPAALGVCLRDLAISRAEPRSRLPRLRPRPNGPLDRRQYDGRVLLERRRAEPSPADTLEGPLGADPHRSEHRGDH